MSEITACIFDLDGVIVDTAKYHFLAWRRLCNELGFDLSEEENEALKGITRAESLDIILAKGGVTKSLAEKQVLMVRKNGWYLEYVDAMSADEILPGAHSFLKLVKASGRKISLGSSSKNAMRILEKIGVLPLFDAVIDGTKVTLGKPDPQTFLLAAEALQAAPDHCVVFEDATAGVEAALAGGMHTIGVGDPAVLRRADIVIPGFEGIGLELFNKI
jgi:beta-phosphoglucomutase